MIVILNTADFSSQNIGKIDRPNVINQFTLDAVAASGNTDINSEKLNALNNFFKKVGAFGAQSELWNNVKIAFLPMLAADLSHCLVDYTDNTTPVIPESAYYELKDGGMHGLATSNNYVQRNAFDSAKIVNNDNFTIISLASECNCDILTIGSGGKDVVFTCTRSSVGDQNYIVSNYATPILNTGVYQSYINQRSLAVNSDAVLVGNGLSKITLNFSASPVFEPSGGLLKYLVMQKAAGTSLASNGSLKALFICNKMSAAEMLQFCNELDALNDVFLMND